MIATAFAAIGFRYDPANTEYDAPLTAHLDNSSLFNEI